jgi:6-phosphofructokinase
MLQGLLDDNVELFGFIGGNKGIFTKNYIQITQDVLDLYVSQSGFFLLGRSSDSLRSG